MKRVKITLGCLLAAIILNGCAAPGGPPAQKKRQAILSMRSEVLTELYKIRPRAKAEIASAPGYAVFSNANVNIIFASFGGGYGVVRDNKTGRDVYMKMGEAGIGLGLGVKDFRAVFVFHDHATMARFISSG